MFPTKFLGHLKDKAPLTGKVSQFLVELSNPSKIEFEAGQFINVKVDQVSYRSYSLCAPASSSNTVSFVAEVAHEGKAANFLRKLAPGDPIEFIGPSGKFNLKHPLPDSVCFLATGTGIAPFISMFYELEKQKYLGSVKLMWGVRHEEDIFFIDKLNNFKKAFKKFDFSIYVSQPTGQIASIQDLYVISGRITRDVHTIVSPVKSQYYICGHPSMVDEAVSQLLGLSVDKDNIFKEDFVRSGQITTLSL